MYKYIGLFVVAVARFSTAVATKPHIVMVLVDDWGWANVGYHQATPTPEVDTPNIDSLVNEGLKLNQHYAFSVCAPSRCSLLTGRLPIHVIATLLCIIQTMRYLDLPEFLER